jgi:hypothetical protein
MESRTRLAVKLFPFFVQNGHCCGRWLAFWQLFLLWFLSQGVFFYYSIQLFSCFFVFFLPISDKIISCSLDCFVHFVPLGDFAVFQWVWINRMCLSAVLFSRSRNPEWLSIYDGFRLFAHSISYTLSDIQFIISPWLVHWPTCLLTQPNLLKGVSLLFLVICLKRLDGIRTHGIYIQIISRSLQKQILLDISAILNSPASKSRDQVRMYYL